MAINITQQPYNFHPGFNDSYLQFSTTFNENDRAVVTLDGTYKFTLFPDNAGQYLFNMREVVKAIINTNEFRDTLDSSTSAWGYTDSSLYRVIGIDIMAYGDSTSEGVSNAYSFNKAVKQFGDKELTNPYQLMLPSEDGMNFYLTYFEGYPTELPFRYLHTTNNIQIDNARTGQTTPAFTPTADGPYRLFLDKGTTNWHSAGVMEIPDMMNRLHVVESGLHATIELTKKANQCGKYLRWFNSDGAYSSWLFHQWYKQEHVGSEIDRVGSNNFSNVYGNQEGLTKITGKSGGSSMKLKTLVTEHEKNHLISLVTSPHVQMWSAEEPYQDGTWIDVKLVSKGFTYANKKTRNHIEVEIELPEWNTQIL